MSSTQLTTSEIKKFQKIIYLFYKVNQRHFAWRYTHDSYKILVSEIMLQQTQTNRVEKKYIEFIKKFPNWKALAETSLKEMLGIWQGMGYNRRALYLQEIAIKVVKNYKNKLPTDPCILQTFKGIGSNTAASICAFAFNLPTVFIETNIRTVFIHYFFKNKKSVSDKMILPLIEQTLDTKHPRVWYHALMDYGVYLKKLYRNPSRKSSHYTKQSKFEGSDRQIRGNILKLLLTKKNQSYQELTKYFNHVSPSRLQKILKNLIKEKLLHQNGSFFSLD